MNTVETNLERRKQAEIYKTSYYAGSILTLTPELIDKVCEHLQVGGYIEDACVLAGISERTFGMWRDKGNEDEEKGVNSLYVSFLRSIKKAHAKATHKLLSDIDKMPMFWQAKAWILERTRFAKFGSKQLIVTEDVTGRVNIPPPASTYDAWLSDSRQAKQLPAPSLTDDMLIAEAVDVEEIEIVSRETVQNIPKVTE